MALRPLSSTSYNLTTPLLLYCKSIHSSTYWLPVSYLNKPHQHGLCLTNTSPTIHQYFYYSSSSLKSFRHHYRYLEDDDDDDYAAADYNFDEAVNFFNEREYYECHDVLEALWMKAEEPNRTLFHGILQCAVGFHHLFNQNHKGAMMELGEGLCKLRKMNFAKGPFHQFETDVSAVLDFIYQTQIELAACTDDLCVAMDRSQRSYQLLGSYAAAQQLYKLEIDSCTGETYIVFFPQRNYGSHEPPKVKLPILQANEHHLQCLAS